MYMGRAGYTSELRRCSSSKFILCAVHLSNFKYEYCWQIKHEPFRSIHLSVHGLLTTTLGPRKCMPRAYTASRTLCNRRIVFLHISELGPRRDHNCGPSTQRPGGHGYIPLLVPVKHTFHVALQRRAISCQLMRGCISYRRSR